MTIFHKFNNLQMFTIKFSQRFECFYHSFLRFKNVLDNSAYISTVYYAWSTNNQGNAFIDSKKRQILSF